MSYEAITYEGYAPGGVAVLVEVLTDNRNRTGSEVRTLFTRSGGSLAEPGAVAWQFERKGSITVDGNVEEDELMLASIDAGADDVAEDDGIWRVTTPPSDLHAVVVALQEAGIEVTSSELTMVPTSTIALNDTETVKSVLRVLDALDDHDDVQAVHANADIPDDILATVEI